MQMKGNIITVGLCPCWDSVCRVEGIDWGGHKVISSRTDRPAGKAMNISRALSWMEQKNTAAGLWGRPDHQQMLEAIEPLKKFVKVKMTPVPGRTRQNITVVDVEKSREMHLRAVSELASKEAILKLRKDLEPLAVKNSVFVFAGAMPEAELIDEVIEVMNCCRGKGARIVLDTSGEVLKRIVDSGSIWLVKPNVEELGQLSGEKVADSAVSLAKAGRELLDKVEIVLISRGRKGVVAVSREGTWQGQTRTTGQKVLSTVGCGDYLLAGFLKGLKAKSDAVLALETAIKVATAKAWGWPEKKDWKMAAGQIEAEVERIL
ncbi:MAG: hypothetical protein KAR07_12755 [Spirochaetes bacterium]|nr:hypothetical protein [Spirochaetota bacterium]